MHRFGGNPNFKRYWRKDCNSILIIASVVAIPLKGTGGDISIGMRVIELMFLTV